MIFKKLIQKIWGSGNISSGTGKVMVNQGILNQGISSEIFAQQVAKYAEELGQTKQLISTFLGILLKEKVPPDQWDTKLREIATNYQELLNQSSTWTDLANDDAVQDDFFRVVEIDQIDSQFNSAGDLVQNKTAYLLIQHDRHIKIDSIVPSIGTVQQPPRIVTRRQRIDTVFYSENDQFQLPHIPVAGSISGLWWLDPPIGQDFNGAGTPSKKIDGRSIVVDVEAFGGVPAPCMIEYHAEFLQYPWIPPATNFPDSNTKWTVAFQVNYSKV